MRLEVDFGFRMGIGVCLRGGELAFGTGGTGQLGTKGTRGREVIIMEMRGASTSLLS